MSEKVQTIELAQVPKDFAYEDYVSSVLNAGGYYLERGIHKREKSEILELDIVTNKFTSNGVEKTISEIKSGDWGFPDIFKVRGWMDYLGFDKASFIVQKKDPNQKLYNDVASQLRLSLIVTDENNGNLNYNQVQKVYAIASNTHEEAFIESLRFSYALERKLISDINSTAKSNKQIEGYQILKSYLFELCDNTFFEASPSRRIYKTFKLFTEHKRITARLDHESEDNPYSKISDDVNISIASFNSLFYEHEKKNKLYGTLYVEMLNRLYVLKHCVEDILHPVEQHGIAQFLENLDHAVLPSNIKEAMTKLKSHSYFYLYPYFWQIFIFLFGGFILEDKKENEYELLSEITGVPQNEIDNALSAFNLLFPLDGGWILSQKKNSIRILRFMPAPFCGIGVNLRKEIYCPNKKLDELKEIFTVGYTYSDMIRYNNLAYNYLLKSKDVVVREKK